MLFIMLLFFFAKIMLKICFLPYIMLNYALHQKYMSLSTAGQNKCLFCSNSYLGIQALSGCQCSQDRSLKGKRKGRELRALEITLFQYRKGEGEKERERERERERNGEGQREREMRMRGSLGEVLTKGRNFVLAGHRPLTRMPWHPALDPLLRPI